MSRDERWKSIGLILSLVFGLPASTAVSTYLFYGPRGFTDTSASDPLSGWGVLLALALFLLGCGVIAALLDA